MKYKKLGRTGMTVSRLCLGTGNWGYSDEPYGNWATTGEKEAFKIMDAALDAGVNFFDCANVYGNHGSGTTGTSEEIIGKWFQQGGGRREKVILGTKVGREMYNNDYDGPNRPEGLSLYKIRRHAEGSLQRLQTDHIELYQMHNVDRSVNWDELWEAFEGLVRSGKVYYVGASKFAGWELMKAQEAARRRNFMGLACEQHRYDMLRRAAELEAFPACIDQGIGVTLYSPLQRGLLGYDILEPNRTLTYEATLDLEKYRPQLTEYAKLCHDLGESVANVTLAWEMHHPAVTAPVIGPATLKDFEEMLRSVEIELTEDVLKEIDRIFPPPQSLFYDERPDDVRPISWN
ncbi:MAG: aldo/keto reductase [Ruminococcaceae bacterium]|nr:aldo/keto reductase [Oscillospiraceae bacterium]